jgi:non-specific protein-tyrosine kinase
MTRIFDALKKSEASRQGAALSAPSVTPMPSPVPHVAAGARPMGAVRASAEPVRSPVPLVGGLDLNEDVIREMTALRVSVESVLQGPMRSVLFVSPQGGEGTSTVALQFAQVLARDASIRPMMLDAHVRRPAYSVDPSQRMAILDPRLSGKSAAASVVPNLFALPPSEELLRGGVFQPAALRQLLDTATAGFDWVILDGPPVLESPDSASLASQVDGVILVVQAGRTKRPVLTRAADLLRKAGARVLGSVLNRRVLEIPEFIYRRI